MPHLFEALQAGFDIGEAFEMVVSRHERTFLLGVEIATYSGKRIIQGLARHLLKILVAFHRGQAKCELQLLVSPYLSNSLRLIWNILFELLPDANRVYQRSIHVESQGLTCCHFILLFVRSR